MRLLNYLLIVFALSLLFVGCASYKAQYAPSVRDWSSTAPPSSDQISYSVYLIGDAGGGKEDWEPPALRALRQRLATAPERSAVIFLGDNLYNTGMPPRREEEERANKERQLDWQLGATADFPGRVFFVPGNHDWYEYGVAGLKREAKYLKEKSDGKAEWLPRPGCGDPVEVELTDSLVLIILDSQWWVTDWEGKRGINEGCEAKSRAEFRVLLQEAFKSNRRKEVLVAMHHPLFSNGQHGGYFSFLDHVFPLREIDPHYWVPLPGLGSLARLFQGAIGTRQDLSSPAYRELRQFLVNMAVQYGNFVFAAGHEHNLQYFNRDDQHFIVSGTGSRQEPARLGNGALFAHGSHGFARLDYYRDGAVWLSFYRADDDAAAIGELVFQRQIKKAAPPPPEAARDTFAPIPAEEAKTLPISDTDFQRNKFGQKLWGSHYRDAYATEVEVPQLDLAAAGLTPTKQGGGFQTNSLRLVDEEGKEYSLRSLDKDPSRTVPYPFNTELALNIVRDNFSASHPLGALAVVPLAEAAGIYHANPELVYLPKQAALGEYNEEFGGGLYLFEERPDDDLWKQASFFGHPEKVVSTFDVLEETRAEHHHRIDRSWTVRSRLFDLLLGDWDRHEDQWRWARIDQGKDKIYRPIPRDRDQAFANYDGLLFALARRLSPKARQWRPYTAKVGPVHWSTYNGHRFDQTFLSQASWSEWAKAIDILQATLTDQVIEQAFRESWPTAFYERDAPNIIATLKARRDRLPAIAREYYEFLAREVDVLGTDERDLFLIERLSDTLTRLSLYNTNKEAELERLLYQRDFTGRETKEVRCYGFGDDDFFRVEGEVDQGILFRLIGGEGKDQFIDNSRTLQAGRRVIVYDDAYEKNEIVAGQDTRDRRGNHPEYNLYDRRGNTYEYDFMTLLPIAGYNPDDQVFLGLMADLKTYGFKKEPYATRQHFQVQTSLRNGGVRLNYRGDFTDVARRWDALLDVSGQTPLYATNFYGFGNETENREEELGMSYNRIRRQDVRLFAGLGRRPFPQFSYYVGPRFEYVQIERTPDRFIDLIGEELRNDIFEGVKLLGPHGLLTYQNVDQAAFPSRGIHFQTDLGWAFQLNGDNYDFPYLNSALSVYQRLDGNGRLVLATRLGFQHRFSDDYPFYHGAILGGMGPNGALRGFRRDRFTGRTAFYQNIDLRWKILYSSNSFLPFGLGVLAGYDYGRVWYPDAPTDRWNSSYGGGLFFTPFDAFSLTVSLFFGEDEGRWLVGGAFFF